MEIKTTHIILMESANLRAIHYDKKTEDTKNNFNNHRYKKWISYKELLKEINDMIESVELAGYDNPIDESYHNALLNVKNTILNLI